MRGGAAKGAVFVVRPWGGAAADLSGSWRRLPPAARQARDQFGDGIMTASPRLRDLGVTIGSLPHGASNSITDVAGVTVGHVTLSDGAVQTGVTAIRPHPGHPFRDKQIGRASCRERVCQYV